MWVKSKMKLPDIRVKQVITLLGVGQEQGEEPDIRVKQVITLLDVGQEQDEATRYKS